MGKNLLGKALAEIPVNPENYVREHYSEMRKKYGDEPLAIKGVTARGGSIRVVARGKNANYSAVAKRFESDSPLEGEVVVGTLADIYSGKARVVERKPFALFEEQEEEMRRICNPLVEDILDKK